MINGNCIRVYREDDLCSWVENVICPWFKQSMSGKQYLFNEGIFKNVSKQDISYGQYVYMLYLQVFQSRNYSHAGASLRRILEQSSDLWVSLSISIQT